MDDQRLSPRDIASLDQRKVFEIYEGWPANAEDAIRTKVEAKPKKYSRVVYLAVGGSATAGDIISDWFLSAGGVEVSVFRGYLPKGRFEDALVLICSTSGDTEETVRLAKIVSDRHLDVVTISAGGKLMELAHKEGISHVKIKMVESPRYTLPYSLFASIAVLRAASLLEGFEWELDEAITNLKRTAPRLGSRTPLSENPAKSLATEIAGTDPSIYASSVTKSIATRFKTTLNENAKMHAHCDYAPDLFHNEVEAWEYPGAQFAPIFLRRSKDPSIESRSMDVFGAMLEGKSVKTRRLDGTGEGNLSQLVTLGYAADFASYYAAILRKVDPFPINLIQEFKRSK